MEKMRENGNRIRVGYKEHIRRVKESGSEIPA